MPRSILITQCLQNDFAQRVGPHDRLPNLLHVGYEESLRLLGESPADGPVARIMRWACDQPEDELAIVHIRDWHDPHSPSQRDHLHQFQPHCLQDTAGARFVFDDEMRGRRATIINASGLNDFIDTPLADTLNAVGDDVRVGLMGVWTEAKITFLAYEMRTRYPRFQLCVCSALTAGSSRLQHFVAIEQLQRLLGVKVVATLGEFIRYLGGDAENLELPAPTHADRPQLVLAEPFLISEVDERLLKYLFRDCQEVRLRPLAGGFSGNLVLGCSSVDHVGHRQTPHVVKIGPEAPIGRERTRFEQIEAVMGNHAPRIAEFIDQGGRGATAIASKPPRNPAASVPAPPSRGTRGTACLAEYRAP